MLLKVFYLLITGALFVNLIKGLNWINLSSDLIANVFIVITAIIIIIFILTQNKQKNGIKEFNLYLASSFIIRVLFMYWDVYYSHIFTLPGSGMDTRSFDRWARAFIENDMTGYSGYSALLGWIYKIFYPNPLWGQYLNVIFSILTIFIIYKVLCELKIEKKYKFYGILIVCFMPNYLITSSILLRESVITFFLTLSIYLLLKWWYVGKWRYIFSSLLLVLAATYLHSGTIAYAVAIFIIIAFANNKAREFRFRLPTVLICIVGIMFFMFIYSNYDNVLFGYMEGVDSVDDILTKSDNAAYGGSAYSVNIVDDSSILGFFINSPIRIFYFLASPLPWDWRGLNDIIAFIGNGLFYSLSLYLGFRAIKDKRYENRNLIIMMIIFALFSALIYSWGVSNAGTALRHRDKFIANFVFLLIISLDAIRVRKKRTLVRNHNRVENKYEKNLLSKR